MAASHGALGGAELPPVDVLIIVALEDELDAVLAEGGGVDGWQRVRDHVHVRTLSNAAGQELVVAAAWTGAMGAMATATRAAPLVKELQPSCLAMCGICAGKRGDVALGDVIVADRVYSFDHGKLVAAEDGKGTPSFFHDITTYNLERSWRMDAAAFRRDLGWAKALLPSRPPTKEAQRRWLLRTLHAHEQEGGPPPLAHPERAAVFRIARPGAKDWAERILELRQQALLEPGPLKLTEAGRRAAEDDHLLYPDGAPADPAFRVHVGPIATGNAVIEDPRIFDRLGLVGRKTLGVEMEAFAIGYVGDTLPQRAIVAKAVSDHAEHDKDDRFREFACRASAAWLFAFLKQHLTPKPADPRAPGSGSPGDPGPRSPFPDLAARWSGDEQPGVGELQQRVELALMLRHPGAHAAWKQGPDEAPETLRAFLEVREPRGRHTMLHVVAVVDGDVDGPTLEAFREHIVKRYGTDQPYVEPSIVYTGAAAAAVVDEAGRWRVDLAPLLELQGLLDFRPYLEEQARMLERDPVYPSELFVPQRLAYRVGFDSFEAADALDALDSWLGQDGPQLMLVLGDFGTGKTFLMHELALRLGKRHLEMGRAITPILVELRKLEKSRSLDALLGQHFIPERGMRRFDHDAFRYMLEEGRVALLFDGFDELALRVTYAAAAEHLNTVLEAAIGKAKVVITSRTQHFLNDRQVLQALGERARQRGFRMMRLLPFDEDRIRQFLVNRFGADEVARRRFDLLGEVKDLLGLSHNPRMLGFIAEIEEQELRTAATGGEITSATLYRVLLDRWLGHEVERDHPPGMEAGASAAARWKAATELAKLLWTHKERTIAVGEIPPEILDEVSRLSERPVGREAAAFKLGSATLLCRDEEGRFSFIHQSVVEWLVASAATDDLREGRSPALLEGAEMSDLMADFLWGLAGKDLTLAWACGALAAPPSELAAANANRALQRLGRDTPGEPAPTGDAPGEPAPTGDAAIIDVVVDLAGHDLRGLDLSGTSHLRGAMLARADLSETSLVGADLSNAVLAQAQLRRANLERASLAGADLRGADLSFARLLGADLTGAKLAGVRLHYAALVGARLDPDALQQADVLRVAPPHPRQLDVTLGAPVAPCASVAFSPDGALLAVGYGDGTVVIRDAVSGGAVRVLDGHVSVVRSIAFSPDGRVLASASDDSSVRLWSPDTGQLLRTLEGHASKVRSVAFSPDGRVLASASADRSVRLWSPDTGQLLRTLEGHASKVRSVVFSPDSRVLASASDDHSIRLWSPDTGKPLRVLQGHSFTVRNLAFSPDGRVLASASAANSTGLWSPDTGKLLRVLQGHSTTVRSVAFSPDGRVLASASDDRSVRLWSPDTGQLLSVFKGHFAMVRSVAFSPDGRVLASASADKSVLLWSPDTGQLLSIFKGHSAMVTSVAFSPDGRVLASASDDRSVRLWSPDTGQLLSVFKGHSAMVRSVAFSPDGRVLASASDDRSVRLWSPDTGQLLRTLESHTSMVRSVAFSPDGCVLASASADNSVRLWSSETGKLLRALEGHSAMVRSVAFSPDGRVLASASGDHSVRLWSIKAALRGDEDACLATIVPGRSGWAAYAPDGRYKLGGDTAGLFGFTVGLCRFEPGELDAYPDAFDHAPKRIGEDEPLFVLGR
jgi:WD40 repeat protein/nucleoside phosphorylase